MPSQVSRRLKKPTRGRTTVSDVDMRVRTLSAGRGIGPLAIDPPPGVNEERA